MKKEFPFSCVAILSLLASPAAGKSQSRPANRPNVIYIYADDMGKGMLSAYGQKQFTPRTSTP